MGLFGRKGRGRERHAAGKARYDALVGQYYGSPDSMAAGGHERVRDADHVTAVFFYAKSVDMLQTAYGYNQMADRRPGDGDRHILEGLLTSLQAVAGEGGLATVAEPARSARNDLDSISGLVAGVGASGPYASARDAIDDLIAR